jgi:hypothetical protein
MMLCSLPTLPILQIIKVDILEKIRRKIMIFRVDQAMDSRFWFLFPSVLMHPEHKLDEIFCDTLRVEHDVDPVYSVFIDQPTQLAALSHALMLFSCQNTK